MHGTMHQGLVRDWPLAWPIQELARIPDPYICSPCLSRTAAGQCAAAQAPSLARRVPTGTAAAPSVHCPTSRLGMECQTAIRTLRFEWNPHGYPPQQTEGPWPAQLAAGYYYCYFDI